PVLLIVFSISRVPPFVASITDVLVAAAPVSTRGFEVLFALTVPWLTSVIELSPTVPPPWMVDWLVNVLGPANMQIRCPEPPVRLPEPVRVTLPFNRIPPPSAWNVPVLVIVPWNVVLA